MTGKNGTAIWTGLKSGAYIVEEVDPADGYSIINASETVYLADSGEQSVVTVRFDNAPDGILLIRKVCATNPSVTLPNAEFKVMYADGTLIGDSNGVYRTDENGEIRIPGLKPGKSVVVTELAPRTVSSWTPRARPSRSRRAAPFPSPLRISQRALSLSRSGTAPPASPFPARSSG